MRAENITNKLCAAMDTIEFSPPVTHVYNPLQYAWPLHQQYLRRFAQKKREIVLVGMNPGPFGMAQTGIPFGEVAAVRDWLQISGKVSPPPNEHPKRPVVGLDCPRSEVSGKRLWGWAKERFKTPECFFERFYVYNYCPLCFMEASGRNFTPDKLPAVERQALEDYCDTALQEFAAHFQPNYIIGIGAFAAQRIKAAIDSPAITIGRLPHPSPANPAANKGWAEAAEKALVDLGIGI